MKTTTNGRIKSVVSFCLVGFLLLFAISWVVDFGVKHSDNAQTGKVNGIINHTTDPELIVFGSSVSEVGVNPVILEKKTGLTAYNCSMDGTRFLQYKGLIDEFRSYSKNNHYVVLVETYFSFIGIDAITSAERYVAQINNRRLFGSLYSMQPGLAWKCRYIPFYKYVAVTHVYYKNSLIGWKNVLKGPTPDPLLGFTPVERGWEADADEAIRNTKPFTVHTDSAILRQYTETIQSLQRDGKKVIVVLTPMYKAALEKVTDISPVRNKLTEVSAMTGAKFLDFSNSGLCSEKRFFYNSNHLNHEGADVFSNLLADSMKAIVDQDRLKAGH